jgi:hypothetical protein
MCPPEMGKWVARAGLLEFTPKVVPLQNRPVTGGFEKILLARQLTLDGPISSPKHGTLVSQRDRLKVLA